MVKKTVDDLYKEIDQIKTANLTSSIKYSERRISRNIYLQIIDIQFNHAIDPQKILKVYDYLKSTYLHHIHLIEKVELKSAHTIQIEVHVR